MDSAVNVNGSIVAPEQAVVSVFDRGFLFGDGIYETMRTWRRTPLLLDEHLARFANSAARLFLRLEQEGGVERVRREVLRTIDAVEHDDAYVRVILTRGGVPGRVDLDLETAAHGTLVVIAKCFLPLEPALYRDGVSAAVVATRRNLRSALDPAIKSGNYLNNLLALHEAREAGAFECIMLSASGHVTEGSTSNVFVVSRGVLRTPALECGLLAGVTRSVVLRIARETGIEAREEELSAADLAGADEAFLSSSLKDLLPVTRIDGRPVGDGKPGPVTRRLLAAYRARVRPGDAG